jgi:hypothetical protein
MCSTSAQYVDLRTSDLPRFNHVFLFSRYCAQGKSGRTEISREVKLESETESVDSDWRPWDAKWS